MVLHFDTESPDVKSFDVKINIVNFRHLEKFFPINFISWFVI